MKEFNIIKEKDEINHSYNVECAAISDGNLIIIIDKTEVDDFLIDFMNKKYAYKIIINTDTVNISFKTRVFVERFFENDCFYTFIVSNFLSN